MSRAGSKDPINTRYLVFTPRSTWDRYASIVQEDQKAKQHKTCLVNDPLETHVDLVVDQDEVDKPDPSCSSGN